MPITRRHLLRIFFYGSFGLVILIGLAHPFSRQLVFGPKIGDLPLCFWQDNFRIYADPYGYVDHDSPASKLFRCLGIRPKIGRCDLPNNKAEMLAVLLSLVDDPRPHVRACLARELIRGISPDDSVPPLLQLLDDHDASVRAAAAWSLWRIEPGPVAALPRLLE